MALGIVAIFLGLLILIMDFYILVVTLMDWKTGPVLNKIGDLLGPIFMVFGGVWFIVTGILILLGY